MNAPTTIPGVVDGAVTLSYDTEGHVSFHITVRGDRDDCVELVVAGEHAARLAASLLAGPGSAAAHPVPCSVGVRPAPGG
ncbi:hypothetical protein [Streptomyces sp. SID13726]|uniref:hypothetical protein n=1 Tax=Streptomyces sp. SID13726 TaxID=2706058 RepID=UPI0013BE589A|nr:hypothetical protein [Streptomyces sp. SID13726]NEB00229.1 hypothetical protein [Streptomyces sp. SID13726]